MKIELSWIALKQGLFICSYYSNSLGVAGQAQVDFEAKPGALAGVGKK